ncbi:hypothetical protein [Solitalea canadensis]|uniref:Uncharacterized protein n=1 Tax=Solitalea canadensis (strain ATCC 29591 / DSM 3403 / JCM 21819 / LMG 8368 / NBRC 15130 / NCIMB 12057 / USAM 9D) TaxID=929556 RepID=H8KVW5_SOLCM|nr:hypothetical protein [Solitalea canadensis]AFD06868.1 hypothetical protein Solca_1806 [Solitalea canadensis DSM 3403]
MKKTALLLLPLFFSVLILQKANAQDSKSELELTRSALQTMKQDVVTQVMNLSDDQSEKFWPLYKEYQAAKAGLNDKSIKLIEDYAKVYDSITDEQANALVRQFQSIQKQQLSLENKYIKKFQKQLPGKVVAKYFQTENKLDAIARYDLAGSIPLVK